jgi:RHH-type proline utilization regulon transcriptional repressor/proline dehydrogenase/delta 1-pyrroline-5-carboxylate dehydrogenase
LNDSHRPLGPVVCISPWNFPLAIFTGQVAAALAAGNPVLAKPAEETPLIAAVAIQLLREAGVPEGAVQLLPGAGEVGARLVADDRTRAVMFTGSTEVARLIQRTLSARLSPDGKPIPLIAETGGQNALIVDSSALPEQVVGDVLMSAFDSAGQRCSALRVLCLQEEAADRVLTMLKGAMAELVVGNPDRLSTDVGPVISLEAKTNILKHVAAMKAKGRRVEELGLPAATRSGTFVAPTLIELDSFTELTREVFGPVLHVVRYRRDKLDRLLDDINAAGYGLTFGVHTRIDETIVRVTEKIGAGNIYVNRNLIGAVVGVQPFGGHGLSGTGPKAGGPLYLSRLLASRPARHPLAGAGAPPAAASAYRDWLGNLGRKDEAAHVERYIAASLAGTVKDLAGPVGERNTYVIQPRGLVACLAQTESGLLLQVGAVLATGNKALVQAPALKPILAGLPIGLKPLVSATDDWTSAGPVAAVLFEGDSDALKTINQQAAGLAGPIVPVYGIDRDALAAGGEDYPLEWLVTERSISTNTAAAGGNASLIAMGE